MTPEFLALGGVFLGALLAGGASLLLAWRQETREAIAGVRVVSGLLRTFVSHLQALVDDFEALQNKAEGKEPPTWWLPGAFPSAEPWKAYQQALASRLSPELVQRIDAAMARVASFDQTAAFRHQRNNDIVARWWTALIETAQEDALPEKATKMLENLQESASDEDWIRLGGDDVETFRCAIAEFKGLCTDLDRQHGHSNLNERLKWHWRPVLAIGTVLAGLMVLAAFGLASDTPADRAEALRQILARELDDEATTACDAVKDRGSRFDCVATFPASSKTCAQRGAHADARRQPLRGKPATCTAADAAVRDVVRYTGIVDPGEECALFTEVASGLDAADGPRGRPVAPRSSGPASTAPGELNETELEGRFIGCPPED
jgi:hypothetical protein